MVKLRTFKKALEKIESVDIRKVPDTRVEVAKTASFDRKTKQFCFFNEKGNVIVKFNQYDVRLISRVLTDDDKFVFLVILKNDVDYKMEFHMRDGYSFFVADEYLKENIGAVIKAVPKYLCDFKGKRVRVLKTMEHSAFSTWNADNDTEDSVVAESFVIGNFDYEVKTMSGLAVVDLLDKDNTSYAKALGVTYIVGDTKDGVMIGVDDGDYLLKILE